MLRFFAFFLLLTLTTLATTPPPGVIVAYSPAESNDFVGSPSLVILPSGDYLASHDLFGKGAGIGSKIYASKDKGATWTLRSSIADQMWSNLFTHQGVLYFMGTYTNKNHRRLILRRSDDSGLSWSKPCEATPRGISVGTAPVTMAISGGRIWRCAEHSGKRIPFPRQYRPFLVSASLDADLMDPSSWTMTKMIFPDFNWLDKNFGGWLEGNVVATPEGVCCMMRVQTIIPQEYAATFTPSVDAKRLKFNAKSSFHLMNGASKKFCVRPDPNGSGYWALANIIPTGVDAAHPSGIRNTLGLIYSVNLKTWETCSTLLHREGKEKYGFQYPDFQFDGEDIIYVSRTAWDGAFNHHDANYLTFHRIKDFHRLRGSSAKAK